MRVLHVVEVTHGGVPTLVQAFASEQVGRGFDVHLLVPHGASEGPGTVHLWAPRRRQPWSFRGAVAQLHQTVRQVRPDVVHLHSFFPGLLGRVRSLPGRPPTVYQPHSWAFEAIGSRPARLVISRWEVRAASRTSAVITNCADELEEGLRAGLRVPLRAVGVPIDTDRFAPKAERERTRLREQLGLGQQLLVCVGRISPQKGQDQLVRAWERRAIDGATLVLVGPGSTSELEQLAPTTFGTSIKAVGEQPDVSSWLHAADVVVQPSRYEGQSVAMAEALACGRPVVMTDVNGVREAVTPPGSHAAGAVVPRGDMDALLDACAERLGDRRLRDRESRAARSRAVALFQTDAVMDRIHRVYEESTRESQFLGRSE